MTKIHIQHQLMMPQMLTAAGWNFSSIFCFSYSVKEVSNSQSHFSHLSCAWQVLVSLYSKKSIKQFRKSIIRKEKCDINFKNLILFWFFLNHDFFPTLLPSLVTSSTVPKWITISVIHSAHFGPSNTPTLVQLSNCMPTSVFVVFWMQIL